ncbi:MAG: hypothetical protein QOG67_3105 [Verrucomicrobiota bacterium]|jgi:hypothetical protein
MIYRCCLVSIIAFTLFGCGSRHPVGLPYGASNPVIYDNDSAVDVYTDEYLLALSSLGEIQLKGMLTSSSIAPDNRFVQVEDYEKEVHNRENLARAAKASGFRNVPTPVRGPKGQLFKPGSGKIEDTKSIGSEGSHLIVAEARKATPQRPLVIIAGGPLTAAADAYLLDPSIADKMIVAWFCIQNYDMGNYNGWADAWAAYIVLQKLKLVQFGMVPPPRVLKSQLLDLPASPLRDFMYQAYLPSNPPGPGDTDGDAPPAIALMRPDYSLKIKAANFGHWIVQDGHEIPVFSKDLPRRILYRLTNRQEQGRTLVVTHADQNVATQEWWRAIRKAVSGG